MTRLPDGIGRTIFIAALAGVMFAAFLLVTPRLTASSGTGGTEDPSTTTGAVVTTTTAAPTTTTAAVPSTTVAPTPTTLPEDGYDGTVTLGLYVEGQGEGKEFGVIEDGDRVTWRLHVTNASDGTLWGVYAYLELNGPAPCEAHILEPGESTDCWIESRVDAGTHEAQAWVNAWTLTRMVKDMVFLEVTVLP